MRLTKVLLTQHLGRMFRRHWKVQGQRVVVNTGAEKVLKEKGIPVYEYDEVLKDIPELESKIVEITEEEATDDVSLNPLWHRRPCYLYKNDTSLLQGLDQAKVLTNTVEIEEGLPKELESLAQSWSSKTQEEAVKRSIMSSHLFDATQGKLPKLHDPERPAWNFPRVYGVVDHRRNRLMSLSMLNLCQILCSSGKDIDVRFPMENSKMSVPLETENDLVQLECRADLLVATKKPLEPYASAAVVSGTADIQLPSIYPMKPTVSLSKENVYQIENLFPIVSNSLDFSVHTAIIHFNETEVKNKYDLPVTEDQFLGRSLVHTYAIAAAQARHTYGTNVRRLEKPVTVQSIHTDGRKFHFSVLQLNSLDFSATDGIKNILWKTPVHNMFDQCSYKKGTPDLAGYNGDVFNLILAFYANS